VYHRASSFTHLSIGRRGCFLWAIRTRRCGKGAQVVGESVFQQQAFGFRLQRATGDLFFFGIKSGENVSRDHSIVVLFTHKRKI